MTKLIEFLPRLSEHPLHRFIGVEDLVVGDGTATCQLTVGADITNPAGSFHGGVIYTVCDLISYAALLTMLDEGENAATHDLHVSVLRAAKLGDRVTFTGRVTKRGREVAFMESEAHCGDRLLARASVTKSILRAR